jgi:hypothetical protein
MPGGGLFSGRYVRRAEDLGPPATAPVLRPEFTYEELRLDVDGPYPQSVVSGKAEAGLVVRAEWIAQLDEVEAGHWRGSVWRVTGDADLLPYTDVDVRALPAGGATPASLAVTYTGAGNLERAATYELDSRHFRRFQLEIDTVEGADGVTSLDTGEHTNRPAGLAAEVLTVEDVYGRAGFEVQRDAGQTIPLAGAGANWTWNNAELHDAMQAYWSRFADHPQWAMWALFAARHDAGRGLGGVMFDDVGPRKRQGVAIFTDTNLVRPPAGEQERDAWGKRMKFFTLVHEMGHALNLAHSWMRSLGAPWIPVTDEPEARSFMNYPERVNGKVAAFFADFHYRFADSELLFMRHGPETHVQMGRATWFDDHGFRQAAVQERPELKLEVRVRPEKDVFEFLEPMVLELKLSNVSGAERSVPSDVLSPSHAMTVVIAPRGKPARQWTPFARDCARVQEKMLPKGDSLYESLFVSAGRNGWDLADPGTYDIRIALRVGEIDVVSNTLTVKIDPPRSRDEERLAQDYFSDDVGRVLAMDGSAFLKGANATLHELRDQFKGSNAALHAGVALSAPKTHDFKRLVVDGSGRGTRGVDVKRADLKKVAPMLDGVLFGRGKRAMGTLGHIDYNYYVQQFCQRIEDAGDGTGAVARRRKLLTRMRGIRSGSGRPLPSSVLAPIAGGLSSTPPS